MRYPAFFLPEGFKNRKPVLTVRNPRSAYEQFARRETVIVGYIL